jgi:hypothetical protein
MPVVQLTDPVLIGPRFRYEHLVSRIVSARGEWVRISLDEVGGPYPGVKQSLLLQAGRLRGLRFNTTTARCPGWICARLVITADPAVTL